MAGDPIGVPVRSAAPIAAAAGRSWPAVYLARTDGTVSLTDLETGLDLCPAMQFPRRVTALAVIGGAGADARAGADADIGDLIVGFGSDLARIRPRGR